MEHIARSEEETAAFAARIAHGLRKGDVLCLHGTLGMGKTVFARGLIRALTTPETEVPSPTFTLVQAYDANVPVWHFDLYRLEDPEEVFELGWEEALAEAITLVEWPERLGGLVPADRLDILFSATDPATRSIRFTFHGTWRERTL